MKKITAPRQGVHYLRHLTGSGQYCYEWISRETGTVKRWTGSLWDWRIMWGDDVTVLPHDYRNTTA